MSQTNFKEAYPELVDKVVLNVDDNEVNQLVMGKILQNVGITTVSAYNGAQAIEKLKQGLKPDLIIMDLEMPVMNGFQASQLIRKEIDQYIPIIINSGCITSYDKWKLYRLNIEDYLEKPYSMVDIFTKLSKYINVLQAH